MSEINYTPLGKLILIKEDPAITKTDGGIIIPESVTLRRNTGTVMAKGHLSTYPIEVGDKVMYPQGLGTEIQVDKVDYYLMFEDALEGVL